MALTIHVAVTGPIHISCSSDVHKHPSHGQFYWHVGPITRKGSMGMPLELSMTNEEKVHVTVTPMTSTGNPAMIDGAAMFAVVDGTCTIEQIDDRSAMIVSGPSPGDTAILVSADADLGQGVQTIEDTILVHVLGAMATSLGLQADPPEPK